MASRWSLPYLVLGVVPVIMTLPACGGGPAAAIAGEPTTVKEAFGVKCDAVQAQTAPDLMAWDSAARANLSRLRDKGIPFVWFPPERPGEAHRVRNMATGAQEEAEPGSWRG